MKIYQAANLFYTSMVTVKADSTIDWYKKKINALVDFFGEEKDIEEIDIFDLENFRSTFDRESHAPGRTGKVTDYTVHGYVRAVKRFFSFCRKRHIIKISPAEDLEKPKLPDQPRKGIDPANAGKMIKASKIDPRDYAVLMFVRDTGCRAGGIYNLMTADLDLKHNRAIVKEKGDKKRFVFFTTETTFALVMYSSVRENPDQDPHFFLSKDHKPLTYYGVYQIFRRLAIKTNVKKEYSPHQWRHTAVRSWLSHGLNLKSSSQIAGHRSEKVTGDIYGVLNERELQELYNDTMSKVLQDWPDTD